MQEETVFYRRALETIKEEQANDEQALERINNLVDADATIPIVQAINRAHALRINSVAALFETTAEQVKNDLMYPPDDPF